MGLANWLKFPVLAAKYPCGVFLRKNGSLGELGHQGFIYNSFGGRLYLLQVRGCKGCCAWGRLWA